MKRKIYYCGYLASVKMLLQKSFVLAFVFILSLSIAKAGEQKTITGNVTNDSGEPLPGVTVVIKGTTSGAVTDVDGNYSIINVPGDATLIFSFVGMLTREIEVGSQSTINVEMTADAIGIEEVVAIGYGTKKKINLTGSVSVANKEQIESRPVGNVQQALQGLVPGLNISPTNAGGEPGADMGMSIRGLTSFEGSSAPYVLVDGVPMGINDINPNDIESISVLKDAASTSIYGARAAYGVILITTKKGQTGANVSYSFNYGVSSPTIWAPSAKGPDWAYALNDAAKNAGGTAPYPEEAIGRLLQNLEKPGSAPGMLPNASGTDWDIMNTGTKGVANDDIYGLLLRNSAPKVNHNLS
ncbi:MAG TPA: TonB-dependent receptor plug domain-containing protein, partial [Draconibacterium sp.]|nr:TonB-dependent receptor plug domain-containing protein [Draconibacterium sp.]